MQIVNTLTILCIILSVLKTVEAHFKSNANNKKCFNCKKKKKIISRHIILKLLKVRDKEKILKAEKRDILPVSPWTIVFSLEIMQAK